MVDPKMLELSHVRGDSAPLLPVVTDPAKAARALQLGGRRDGAAHPGARRHRLEGPALLQRQGGEAARRGARVGRLPGGGEAHRRRGGDRPRRRPVPAQRPTGEAADALRARTPSTAPRRGCGRRRPRRAGRATTRCSRRPSTRTRPSHPLRIDLNVILVPSARFTGFDANKAIYTNSANDGIGLYVNQSQQVVLGFSSVNAKIGIKIENTTFRDLRLPVITGTTITGPGMGVAGSVGILADNADDPTHPATFGIAGSTTISGFETGLYSNQVTSAGRDKPGPDRSSDFDR